MRIAMKKKRLVYSLCLILCLLPCVGGAALVIKTELVSGKIVQIYGDRSVKLDNGFVYLPSRKGLKVNLPAGEAVTLRYTGEVSGKKVFFEYAPGMGSLSPLVPYSPKEGSRKLK